MKKILLLFFTALFAAISVFGQAPGIFNYQGVARNSVGNVLQNQSISLRLTIHDGAAAGPAVYAETRTVVTNAFGLFNVQVGSPGASSVTGTIAGVPWGVGSKFLQVEIDPNNGSGFINLGTAQIASVPYAFSSGDLTLPFTKTQSSGSTLFNLTNTGAGAAGSFTINSAANSGNALSGQTNGTGAGVLGSHTAATGTSPGVRGETNSTDANASGVQGVVTSTTPGGFSSGVRGVNNGTGGLGIGVYGSQGGSGWGVYGTTPSGIGVHGNSTNGFGVYGLSTGGIGVYGLSTNAGAAVFEITNNANASDVLRTATNGTGWAANFSSTNATPRALRTTGGLQFAGISEGAGKVLTSDASGNATWQTLGASGGVSGSGTLNFVPKWTPDGSTLGNSLLFDNGTSIGLGTTTPTHRFDVVHGGSTGIGITSTSGFSVLDINAATGDAAIRFGNNGTNQWNLRNRPGDDYLEIFELGGGGSRVVIQDGTGNFGIGETANPTYKLDVLHGGSTGIRSRSTGSFSVVDIDGASGDAALRFANNGVNQWNIRNRPGDDYLEIFELGGGGSRFVIQDGTGNVGIGETVSPSYKLDVLHGGATGIRSRSNSTFSLIDIDAANGDAALRFAKAGVNQWNTRNRPADDYYEIFELGGGGSRFVIQDGTGNVGIGETTNPTYKLDVLHGGATGIRSRSESTFSLIDIDAANGDAALRFAKAGVNQWNTRNRPADDYYEIFELGGGGSRFVIQDGTGNVGIGETTNPTYRLDVLHGGATGIRSRSNSTFSLIDIDGANGDAALRFAKAGVNQWNIRNNPATDDLQFFELGGGGERMRIENTTGNVVVTGNLSKGGGSFKIDHPLDPANKYLYHSFVESPDMMNIYNGNITTDASGKATVKLPEYFEALNMEFRYQLTVIGSFSQAIVSKEISGNVFEVATDKPNVKVSWMVTGVRHDAYANKNRIPNEVEKESVNKGKYLHPDAFNQPKDKGINYDDGKLSSLNQVPEITKGDRKMDVSGSVAPTTAAKSNKTIVEPEQSSLNYAPAVTEKKATTNPAGPSSIDAMPAPVEKKAIKEEGVNSTTPVKQPELKKAEEPKKPGVSN